MLTLSNFLLLGGGGSSGGFMTIGGFLGWMNFTCRLPALSLPLVILRERTHLTIGYPVCLGFPPVELISEPCDFLKDVLKPCEETRFLRSQQRAIVGDEGLQPQMKDVGFLKIGWI